MVRFKRIFARLIAAVLVCMFLGSLVGEVAFAADTPPEAPEEIWFHDRTRTALQVSWKASEGATSYRVYRWVAGSYQPFAETSEEDAAEKAQIAGISENLRLIELTSLKCGEDFQFVIGAVNEFGESGSSPELATFTDPCLDLAAPVLSEPADNVVIDSNTEIKFSWSNSNDDPIDGHRLVVSGPGEFEVIINTDLEEWTLDPMYPGDYEWNVTSIRGEEEKTSESRKISVLYFQNHELQGPTPLSPVDVTLVGEQPITLTWTMPMTDVQGFIVQVKEKESDDPITEFAVNPEMALGNLGEGTYEWLVLYQTANVRSAWSPMSTFTITVPPEEPDQPVLTPTITSPVSGTVVVTNEVFLLSWTDIEGADGYNVEVEGPGDFLQTGFVTTTQTSLQFEFPGMYFAKVQAAKAGLLSEWSSKVAIIVDAPLEPVIDCNTWVGSPSVLLFFETTCLGENRELPIGKTNLLDVGMENSVASIFVPEGSSIRVFRDAGWQGPTNCYAQTMWNLALDYYWESDQVVGNSISSVEVFSNSTCTPNLVENHRLSLPSLRK